MLNNLNPRKLSQEEFLPLELDELSPSDVGKGLADFGLIPEKVPPYFTSEGLYDFAESKLLQILAEEDGNDLVESIRQRAHDYVRYESLRDSNIPRHLGIAHPESNTLLALAIQKNWIAIGQIVSQSQPRPSRIYVRRINGNRIFEMNYKGSERWECEEIEIDWRASAQWRICADISMCFPSIYTHSLPWALNGWTETKDNHCPAAYAGNLLDRCVQACRDKQTNGLLIGPHTSNVISEIILCQIDQMLQDAGFSRFIRYIDDYTYYAKDRDEGERFLRELTLSLRHYQLSLNEKKTRFEELPASAEEDWVSRLKRFRFPPPRRHKVDDPDETPTNTYSDIQPFLDLALELARTIGKSTPLNYALKVVPETLNQRGRRLFMREAYGLALKFPYLASLIVTEIISKHPYENSSNDQIQFASQLWAIGIKRIYPDAIAHALFISLKEKQVLQSPGQNFLDDADALKALELHDCVCAVLLLEYGKIFDRPKLVQRVKACARTLKSAERRRQDQFWLLLYWTWTERELRDANQEFLADLKATGFSFKLPET